MARIVVQCWSGHPSQVELSRELARRGNDVRHLYFMGVQGPKGGVRRREDDPPKFSILGVEIPEPYAKYHFFKRWFQEQRIARRMAELVREWRPDYVISANAPLDIQKAIKAATHKTGARYVFWLQDIQSVAMAKLLPRKIPILGSLISRYYGRMERRALAQSDHVVAISSDFVDYLKGWKIPIEHCTVIENWSPKDKIRPEPKDNPWSRAHGLVDKRVFLYGGTLGLKHNPGLLRAIAVAYKDRPDVMVVVASEGLGADWLAEKKSGEKLDRLLLLPFQPYDQLSEMLGSGDVHICILESDAGKFSVPSKVLSYMAAGKAQLLSVPLENGAAKLVTRVGSGLVTPPDETGLFLEAAKKLMEDEPFRLQCAENARRYAEQAFNISEIANRFDQVMQRASGHV